MARSTQSRSQRDIPAPVEVVWRFVADQPGHAAWFPAMRSVTPLPASANGEPTWRHDFLWTVLLVTVQASNPLPASPIDWRIRDERGHFEARWRFVFQAEAAEACTITIEEDRTVHGTLARIWIKLMLRPDHYINKYLDALREAAMRRSSLP